MVVRKIKKLFKKKDFYIVLVIVLLAILVGLYIYMSTNNSTEENKVYIIDIEPTALTEEETDESLAGYGSAGALEDDDLTIMDMLTYAVQDEYLAHGEYDAIMDKFGTQKPYSNIVLAEETHLAYLKEVYASYDIEFPEDDSNGHIVIPDNLLEAAQTGVTAEVNNIAMYNKFLDYELPDNVRNVFIILRDASENHLSAFENQVEKLS
ncbi:MAG TPA: hypothetical protein PLC53_00465 [Bacilli bacterium]|nr:hypothetical protein [Bacilli bacterium]